MKKVVKIIVSIMILIVCLALITGCVNYKTKAKSQEDTRLSDEIAKVEQELQMGNTPVDNQTAGSAANLSAEEKINDVPPKVEQEVVLPELAQEPAHDQEMQVIQVKENGMVNLNVKVNDPDHDPVQYSFSPPLNKQGQWKTNYGDAGEYVVTLSATDGKLTTEKKLKIVVNRVNVPPQVSGVSDIHLKEGETANFKPVVTDPNGDKVTVTVSKPLQDGTWVTDHTSAGDYQIKVVASDGELQTEKNFLLKVDDINQLPVITEVEDMVVKEGEAVKIKPVVSDLDSDPVKVTISDPVGDDGVWQIGYTDHGEYFVTVTANDGKGTVTKKVKVTVEDVNMPPEIVEVKLAVN